jgi:radical SAM superfamily enzyme YgiQ (UPF0313 family)
MDVALVFPPSTFLTDPMVWPPLGMWYLSAQLEAQNHYTEFFDLSMEEFKLQDGDFDQVWISASAAQMYEVRKIGEITKNWERTKTVFGGPAVWANPQAYMNLPFDLLVVGEGDHPDTIKQILGKAYFGTGVFYPKLSKTLDWVLPPNRKWIGDYHAYMPDREGNQHRMMSLFTSRGCPMLCSFCESGRHGVIWDALTRYEPMHIVEHQIREGRDLGFTGLAYYDDIFITVFRCFLRSDILVKHGGKDYLKELVDGGLIEIFIGVESADNQIKENIHKGTTIEQDTMVVEWCKELGVTCKTSFIFGLPGESYESMNRTRDWILKHRPTIVQVDRLVPFPGTPLTSNPE